MLQHSLAIAGVATLIAISDVPACAEPAPRYRASVVVYAAVKSDKPVRFEFVELSTLATPTNTAIARSFPKVLRGGFMGNATCRLDRRMRMTACRVYETDPDDPIAARYAARLLRSVKVDFGVYGTRPQDIDTVEFSISVDDGQRAVSGHRPCLAPICVITLPPPPPPGS